MQIGVLEPSDFSKNAIQELGKIGVVKMYSKDSLEEFLSEIEVLFIRLHYQIDKDFLSLAPKLKIICTPTTGLNHLDIDAIESCDINVISLKGEDGFLSTIRATPEHTLGLILSLLRNYKNAFLNQKNSKWNRDFYKGHEIYGKKVGIIGMGRVGKIVAKYLDAMDAKIFYTDIKEVDVLEYAIKVDSLVELIKQSDIIILSASYNEKYRKFIGKLEINAMQGKYFINTARGELVDESYLIHMISMNHFAGVAIDVISNEADCKNNILSDLLNLTEQYNLLVSPHIAGATYESMWRTEEFIVNKLINFLKENEL